MKLWELEERLRPVAPFREPDVRLEQYPTSCHLAACVLYTAWQNGDIAGRRVCDLGCGTGMLSLGASVLSAAYVCGVDIDPSALGVALENAATMGVSAEFLQSDVRRPPWRTDFAAALGSHFDTVVMNPPFGTRNSGLDSLFVHSALQIAPVVYSLHKKSTLERLSPKWGCRCEALAELKFDIPKMYSFHKKASADVEVVLLRFRRR